MAMFDWNVSPPTQKVDAEHCELVALIDRLTEHDASISELLGNLYINFAKHFAYEEAIMRALCYDGYDEHQADHQRLLHEITTAMFNHRSETQIDGEALAKRLYESFRNHLLTHDERFHVPIDALAQVI